MLSVSRLSARSRLLTSLVAGIFVATACPAASPTPAADNEHRCLIEAEAFQFPGNWYLEGGGGTSGSAFLRTANSESDALTVVSLPAAGRYHLWTRARDFATQQPKARRWLLVIDSVAADTESGQHGEEGWRWELVGTRDLTAGDHVLGLRDSSHFFPRCDALYFTTGDEDPNAAELKSLARYRLAPKIIPVRHENKSVTPPALRPVAGARPLAQIGSDAVRVTFYPAQDAAGRPAVLRETALRQNNAWTVLPFAADQETLFLVYSPQSDINTASFFPFWPHGEKVSFEIGGKSYESRGGHNPFNAGETDVLVPRTCR